MVFEIWNLQNLDKNTYPILMKLTFDIERYYIKILLHPLLVYLDKFCSLGNYNLDATIFV